MRVTLLHNESAGSENHARDELVDELEGAGHVVVDAVSDLDALLASVARRSSELVVVAGGDGTVSRTACALAGRRLPLAILPLGTANNTARALGVEGSVAAIVSGWSGGTLLDFDLATIHEGERLTPLSEAVGWGVFPEVIRRADEHSAPDQRELTLERDRRIFRRVVERATAAPYVIEADGEPLRGDYLMVEVVNIPYIGPKLPISPGSDPSDGKLELVLVGESERAALLELVERGTLPSGARLPTRKVEHVTVRTEARWFHRDGVLLERAPDSDAAAVVIEPASVKYLLAAVPRFRSAGK